MKILFRKLKRSNKFLLTLFIITFGLYIIGYTLFTKNLLSLSGIETGIRVFFIIFFFLWLIFYLFLSLIKLIKRNYKALIITTIISLLFSIVFYVSSFYINLIYDKMGNLTESNTTIYTTYLINFNGDEFNEDKILGMVNDKESIEGYILANKLIKKEKLKNKVIKYSGFTELLNAFYNKEVDAIFVSSNYKTLFGSDAYPNIGDETNVLYKFSEKRKNEDKRIASNKELTEPFTLLVMGVDSEANGLNANAAFNGDTLIYMTFNPKTLTASMFSIPRDTYVPIACRNNAYSKINSSAAYGTNCVINTVENLTGIKVDYYVKVNFKAVVELVEAVKGVEVMVEEPDFQRNSGVDCKGMVCEQNSNRDWGNDTVYIKPGWQKLNGEQALAYARCRHLYIESDLARNRHQQEIITALAKKALKIRSQKEFENILDAVSNNIATNMSMKEILSSYDILKSMITNSLKGEEMVNIKKSYLEVYSLPVNLGRSVTSALGHYPGSIDDITKMMRTNLGKEEPTLAKTFTYDINTPYQEKVYGKGITTGEKLQLLPSFVGQNVSVAREYASRNNFNLIVNGSGDIITTQSLASGTLVKNIKSLTVSTVSNIVSDDNRQEDTED